MKKRIVTFYKKNTHHLLRTVKGFTMIELLIVVAVTGILSTLGAGLYQDYGSTKRVSTAAEDVANLLTVAKTRAISQVKPAACGSSELSGYRVVTCSGGCNVGNYTYQLEAFCGGNGFRVGPVYKLPANVSFGSTSPQSVLFRTLTGAALATSDITVSSNGKTMTISTSRAGLIAMSGLESSVPSSSAPVVTFSSSSTSVAWGGSVTLTWTATGANSCTASGDWAGTKASSNTTGETLGPLNATSTYILTCTGPGGTSPAQNIVVTVGSPSSPVISSFTAEDPVLPSSNTGTIFNWTTTGSITGCTASAGAGSWTGSQSFPTGSFNTGALAVTTMYTLTCVGPLGSSTPRNVTVTVSATAPTPTPTPKTVLVDATSNSGAEVSASTVLWSHTVSGTSRLLMVGIVTEAQKTVTVTWKGSQTFVNLPAYGYAANQWAYISYLVDPSLGTGNVTVTLNSSDALKAGAVSFINANQTTLLTTYQSDLRTATVTSGSSISTPSITSSSNEMIFDVLALGSHEITSGTVGGLGQQVFWNVAGGSSSNPAGAGSYKEGSPTTTTSWSWTGSDRATVIAVPIKVAP